MAVELNAEHVVGFALQPVSRRPEGNNRGDVLAVGDPRFDAYSLIFGEGIKNPDDVELFFALGIMDRRYVDAVVELVSIPEQLQEGGDERAVDLKIVLTQVGPGPKAGTELLGEFRNQGRGPGLGGRSGGLGRCSRFGWRSGLW